MRFISDESILSISHRETIIGIRNARPQQNELACGKVGRVQFAGYASSKSIKPWIRVVGKTPSTMWLAKSAQDTISMEMTHARNALDLAHSGVGRALLPTFIGEQQKGLFRVSKPIPELAHDQWLVTHQEERFKPEVRLIIDRIAEQLQEVHRQAR